MPPLTVEGASALVPGGGGALTKEIIMQAQQKQPQMQSVRIVRAFYFNGKPTKVGETIELPRLFALEMKAAHKVEIVAAKAEDKPEPKKAEARAGQKALV